MGTRREFLLTGSSALVGAYLNVNGCSNNHRPPANNQPGPIAGEAPAMGFGGQMHPPNAPAHLPVAAHTNDTMKNAAAGATAGIVARHLIPRVPSLFLEGAGQGENFQTRARNKVVEDERNNWARPKGERER